MEYTPENITSLGKNEIFTFGANENGTHGLGAAKLAHEKFGARWGQGFGLSGKTFALPTKSWRIETLPLPIIKFYIDRYLVFAALHPAWKFWTTKVGCGLGGLTPEQIAPLFLHNRCLFPANVILPKEFYDAYYLTIPE